MGLESKLQTAHPPTLAEKRTKNSNVQGSLLIDELLFLPHSCSMCFIKVYGQLQGKLCFGDFYFPKLGLERPPTLLGYNNPNCFLKTLRWTASLYSATPKILSKQKIPVLFGDWQQRNWRRSTEIIQLLTKNKIETKSSGTNALCCTRLHLEKALLLLVDSAL